jgi:hypothetical protein
MQRLGFPIFKQISRELEISNLQMSCAEESGLTLTNQFKNNLASQ